MADEIKVLNEADVITLFSLHAIKLFGVIGDDNKAPLNRFHWRVLSTGLVYFRRYFTKWSIRQKNPSIILLACIFLAGKTEHSFVHSKDLLKCAGQYSNADIITAEAEVIETLNFNLLVSHPHSLLKSMILDWRAHHQKSQPQVSLTLTQSSFIHSLLKACHTLAFLLQATSVYSELSALSGAIQVIIIALGNTEVDDKDLLLGSLERYLTLRVGSEVLQGSLKSAPDVSQQMQALMESIAI